MSKKKAAPQSESELDEELRQQRRKVDFDTFDIVLQQLLQMLVDEDIDIAPAYQRQYRWDDVRASQLVESLFLGIPIPSLFMASNEDSTWELVDGLQRLTAVTKFCGDADSRKVVNQPIPLRLEGLKKLKSFNGLSFYDLPITIQKQFHRRAFKVVTLSDKSDKIVRFDLFERLNRGGIRLSPQEIRHCVLRGKFADFLEEMAKNKSFRRVVRLKSDQERDATREECVLRFFAYLHDRKSFEHLVDEFLTSYMEKADKSFDYEKGRDEFEGTFSALAKVFPHGLRRKKKKTGVTSLVLFEAISVGAALAIKKSGEIESGHVDKWLGHESLQKWTTGATNNRPAVDGRIGFCRDRFLGMPVPESNV
jgi:hypothetical protein